MVKCKDTKVLITCWFNDKILGDHFLVHEGCVDYDVLCSTGTKRWCSKNFINEPTGDKYFTIGYLTHIMAVQVEEFSSEGCKIRKIFA